jgi:acetyl esterase
LPIDPDAERFCREWGDEFAFPPGVDTNPALAGEFLARRRAARPPASVPEPVEVVLERTVPGGPRVRAYVPRGEGPFPLLLYFHGGGWVTGDLETNDALCRRLANLARCSVVNVDYRLAPEHPFPAAFDDCLAATSWAQREAATLHADPTRLVVAGASAGGNLAAAVALRCRGAGQLPIALQVLLYPALDPRMDTVSYDQFGEGYILERAAVKWFWQQYLPDDQRRNPLGAPAFEERLEGVAPAIVVTAEFDPLRDEGEAYAERLRSAGVEARVLRCDGQIHGFLGLLADTPGGSRAIGEIVGLLGLMLERPDPTSGPVVGKMS